MRIEEVTLETASLARTRLFYHKTLELPVEKETGDTITFRVGASLLTFREVHGTKPYYHIAFNITNNKFSDSFEWVSNKLDILFPPDKLPIIPYPEWNAQSFYFLDNNGSILEFITRFDLPYLSKEPFSINDIKEISELGIVSSEVSATAEAIRTAYGLPYFSKSKPSENFAVLGDDSGLLIIIPPGHHWVPTNKPARVFPMTIKANGQELKW
jgi:catechol 2,3-dioxygenase-like lactoylglutathione lyase family enzyme